MINRKIFDEALYPIAWRFNSVDCHLSPDEKKSIIFFSGDSSESLWESVFSFDTLMSIKPSECHVIEKIELDFDEKKESEFFFVRNWVVYPILYFSGGDVRLHL